MSTTASTDLRKNVANEDDESFFVVDTEREVLYAGPFGSAEYAETVKERTSYPWPEDLAIGQTEVSTWRE